MRLTAHTAPVPAVALGDGHTVLSASYDGSLIAWDASGDRLVAHRSFDLHRKGINCVAAQGDRAATGGSDSAAMLVHLGSGETRRLEHPGDVESIVFLPDGTLATGGTNREVRVWSADGELLRKYPHGGTVGALCLHEGYLVSGCNDGQVRVFDTDGPVLHRCQISTSPVKALASTVRGLLVTSHDTGLYLVDPATGAQQTLHRFTSTAKAMAAEPGGRAAWIAVYDNRLYRLDLDATPLVPKEAVFEPTLWNHALACDDRLVVAGSFHGAPAVWRIDGDDMKPVESPVAPVPGLSASLVTSAWIGAGDAGRVRLLSDVAEMLQTPGAITSLAALGQDLLVSAWAGEVLRYTPRNGSWAIVWRAGFDAVCPALRLDTNGREVVVGLYTGGALGLDANTGTLLWRQKEATGAVKCVSVSGPWSVLTGRYDPARLIRTDTGEILARAKLETSVSDMVVFSPFVGPRPRFAITAKDNEIWFFEVADDDLVRVGRSQDNPCAVKALLWIDSETVVAGDYDGTLTRHHLSGTSDTVARIPCRLGISSLVRLSEDEMGWTSFDGTVGRLLIPAPGDRLRRPIRTRRFDRVCSDRGHRGYVRAAGFVQGGVVSIGYDGTLRKYAGLDLRPMHAVHAHARSGGTLSAASDGNRVATGGADGYVRIWNAAGETLSLLSEHLLPVRDENPLVETVCWSPDGTTLIVGGVGGSLWELPQGGTFRRIEEQNLISINALAFSPGGTQLYVASDDCTVRRYERTPTGFVHRGTSHAFDDHVDGLAIRSFSTGAYQVAAVTHGNRIWIEEKDLQFLSASMSNHALNAVVFWNDMLLAAGDDRTLFAIDPDTLRAKPLVEVRRDVDHLAVDEAGHLLVSTTGALQVVELPEGRILKSCQNAGALAAVVSRGGRLYVGHHDAPRLSIGRWEGAAGHMLRDVALSAPVSCGASDAADFGLANGDIIHVSPNGQVEILAKAGAEVEAVLRLGEVVIAGDRDGYVTFIAPQGTRRVLVTEDGARLKALAPMELHGERFILAAGKDHRLYGLTLDGQSWVIEGSNVALRTFNSIAAGPGGEVFLGTWDSRIHRLVLDSPRRVGQVLPPLEGHEHAVESLVLVGGRLVSVSYDGTARVWTLNGRASVTLQLSELAIRRLVPAGVDRVLTAGYDGYVYELDVRRALPVRCWEVA